jgi:lipopolysaccharide transport system ATP-binding protein
MSDVILRVENVSKLYRLGAVGTGTFGGDVQRFWKTKILGQEDPFLKVGQTNDRTSKEKAEFVWALQDINFEVKRGEVLGIIGKNGAGKSTLLKLLSRITSPTTGTIKSAGRMASLLEVGTGFHPELTGRENIFLNGAILGMTKKEIQNKFDEIVDFSGCELYIDTPTKRYSSGMTVRLGFAVAAFLDPEILVVDEVLAVGDAEFQKKAIGKMQDVSKGEGKTVLFVSHNMESLMKLCPNSILLDNGKFILKDKTESVIRNYIFPKSKDMVSKEICSLELNDKFAVSNFSINGLNNIYVEVEQGNHWGISFDFENFDDESAQVFFNIELIAESGFAIGCFGNEFQKNDILLKPGKNKLSVDLGIMSLKSGLYSLNFYIQIGEVKKGVNLYEENYCALNVSETIILNDKWNAFINENQHGCTPILWEHIEVQNMELKVN